MDKQKKLNKLKRKKERLSTILLSKKKLAKENLKFMSWTLIFPFLFVNLSFIMNCILLHSTFAYVLLISSLALYIPIGLINLAIELAGGYKMILQNRIKNIQSKIEKLESIILSKNKSINEFERTFLGIEQPKKEKTSDDVLYTEEIHHQYMQMPETSPAPLDLETIFDENEPVKEKSGPRLVKRRRKPGNK